MKKQPIAAVLFAAMLLAGPLASGAFAQDTAAIGSQAATPAVVDRFHARAAGFAYDDVNANGAFDRTDVQDGTVSRASLVLAQIAVQTPSGNENEVTRGLFRIDDSVYHVLDAQVTEGDTTTAITAILTDRSTGESVGTLSVEFVAGATSTVGFGDATINGETRKLILKQIPREPTAREEARLRLQARIRWNNANDDEAELRERLDRFDARDIARIRAYCAEEEHVERCRAILADGSVTNRMRIRLLAVMRANPGIVAALNDDSALKAAILERIADSDKSLAAALQTTLAKSGKASGIGTVSAKAENTFVVGSSGPGSGEGS